MKFLSVCSGIEAASVAWQPLGWSAIGFSEIEPFPCALLAHHYPEVPNYGDMTALPARIAAGEIEAPDVLCGGTPCQAFSVAGLRQSLDDARGNLSLIFCDIADEIDTIRAIRGEPPVIILWENVPGVLNTKDNAFGCLLGQLAGEDSPLEPPGGRWTNAGCVFGPKRTVAWRILDAQYFGLAQRRRRVFVVASARPGFDPISVLFESDGVRRDSAPSREPGQGFAGSLASCAAVGGLPGTDCSGHVQPVGIFQDSEFGVKQYDSAGTLRAGRIPEHQMVLHPTGFIQNQHNGVVTMAHGEHLDKVVSTLDASYGRLQGCSGQDTNHGYSHLVAFDTTQITSPANVSSPKYGDPCHPLAAKAHPPAIAMSVSLRGREGGATAELGDEVGNCLRVSSGGGDKAHVLINACSETNSLYNQGFNTVGDFDACTQETDTIALLRSVREVIGAKAFTQWGLGILDSLQSPEILRSALHGHELRPAAFSRRWMVCCALGSPFSRSAGAMHSMREAAGERCASQGWGFSEQQFDELGTYLSQLSQPGAQAERLMCDLWLAAEGPGVLQDALSAVQKARRSIGSEGQPIHASTQGQRTASAEGLQGTGLHREIPLERVLQQTRTTASKGDVGAAGSNEAGGSYQGMGNQTLQVRRLVVEECEFLQGFSRGYTAIPWRKKPAADCPDGPRYKALGNSWAVPCISWIGQRIDLATELINAIKEAV